MQLALEKFRSDNEKGVTVDGVHYTGYQATQMQRKLERAIRDRKLKAMVDEPTGDKENWPRIRPNWYDRGELLLLVW